MLSSTIMLPDRRTQSAGSLYRATSIGMINVSSETNSLDMISITKFDSHTTDQNKKILDECMRRHEVGCKICLDCMIRDYKIKFYEISGTEVSSL